MKGRTSLDKQEMTDEEKEVFIGDVKCVCGEYFETGDKFTVDVTQTENGFSVCIIFDAHRIKNFKKPR